MTRRRTIQIENVEGPLADLFYEVEAVLFKNNKTVSRIDMISALGHLLGQLVITLDRSEISREGAILLIVDNINLGMAVQADLLEPPSGSLLN